MGTSAARTLFPCRFNFKKVNNIIFPDDANFPTDQESYLSGNTIFPFVTFHVIYGHKVKSDPFKWQPMIVS